MTSWQPGVWSASGFLDPEKPAEISMYTRDPLTVELNIAEVARFGARPGQRTVAKGIICASCFELLAQLFTDIVLAGQIGGGRDGELKGP